MAQNYTRQSTFSDGDTITSSLFNDEYNQLVNVFTYSSTSASTTGHRHDGTAGQGGNIFKIGDLDFLNKIEVDSTNNRWGFYVEVSSAAVEQIRIQDGSVVPVTTNDIDLGTSSLQFKDLYIDGTANVDSLTLTSGSTVTTILDEDDLSSDSATALVTQQSVKAYVDAQVTAQDLDFQADSGGALSIDLDSEALTLTGGTGVDTSGAGNEVTFAIDSTVTTLTGSQTLTNKTLTSPDVNTPDIDGGTIDGTVIGGATPAAVSATTVSATGNITVGGTVDGRDVAADGTKLDTVETNADVTDTTNVTAAGALMDSEVTNLAQVKAFDSADYATAAQGTTADNALPKTGGAMTGAITTNSTFDGRDVATDGTKLDGIEALADVTDTTNVTAAGAVMDSELTSEAAVKALNQGVATTDSPTFAGATVNGTVEFDGLSGTGAVTVTDILDQDNMSSNSATALATQQSIKSYVDSQVATSDTLAEVLANGNATGGTDVAVGTGDDITFADSSKAIFGAGSDLQIYHDGSNSRIREVGTGSLLVDAESVYLRNTTGDSYFQGLNGGAANVFHNGVVKLATTSTGIGVSGTVSADGLTVLGSDNSTQAVFSGSTGGSGRGLRIATEVVASTNEGVILDAQSTTGYASLTLQTASTDRINIASNGDISFYEDTGTTAKLFWDASAESLGLGTSSPTNPLTVVGTGASTLPASKGAVVDYQSSSVTDIVPIGFSWSSSTSNQNPYWGMAFIPTNYASAIGELGFYTGNTERMRIDSTGIDVTGAVTADGLTVDGTVDVNLGSDGSNIASFSGASAGRKLDIQAFAVGASAGAGYSINATSGQGELDFQTTGSSRLNIDASGDISFYEDTGTTPKFFWDAADERLGLGLTNPSQLLHLKAAGADTYIQFGNNTVNAGYIGYNSAGDLNFWTNASTRAMTIDSSSNVGIGTSSPSAPLTVQSDTGASTINLVGRASDGYSTLAFRNNADTSTLAALFADEDSDDLQIHVAGDEAMRIDSSQNVLVGKTATDFGVAGVNLENDGSLSATRSGASPANFNRLASDGDIVRFFKDGGSPVGSIGTSGGELTIGNGDVGLYFWGDSDKILPFNSATNAVRDAAIDLGRLNTRFKDGHFSGNINANTFTAIDGVYIGGTGFANKLDDYEEGTWTPAYAPSSGSFATIVYDPSTAGSYTKVGNMCTVWGLIRTENVDVTGASGSLLLTGLPFTASGFNGVMMPSLVTNFAANDAPHSGYVQTGGTTINLRKRASSDGSTAGSAASDLNAGVNADHNYMIFAMTYRTA